jgi:outer membrane protein OmpA-like peptidoglycan-associated protein
MNAHRSSSLRVAVSLLVVSVCSLTLAGQAPRESTRVPLVAGLTITGAIVHASGDSEAILAVQSVTSDSYRLSFSAEIPDSSGVGTRSFGAIRRVLMKDHRNARTMRNWYGENDPETFPGTTPFLSGAIIEDLRRDGRAALTLLVATSAATLGQTEVQELTGTISRLEPAPVEVPVLVNGRVVDLPAIHARAHVGRGPSTRSADLYVLDDPGNPIILRWRDETRDSRIVKLDFPVPRVERELSERRSVEVHGIYFSFGSASIRPESDRALVEIAGALKRNPAWTLRIEGHTDSVGSESANLELSKRRGAAVKEALVSRFGIAEGRLSSDGRGEASPKATNDTAEGRAQNRRVELSRPYR